MLKLSAADKHTVKQAVVCTIHRSWQKSEPGLNNHPPAASSLGWLRDRALCALWLEDFQLTPSSWTFSRYSGDTTISVPRKELHSPEQLS